MQTVEVGKRITLKNVLFATDFSPCSNAALPYALSVASQFGATLHATHVMPTIAEMVLMSPDGWPTMAEEADEKRVQACFEQLEKQFQGLPTKCGWREARSALRSPRSSRNVRSICSSSALTAAPVFAN